MPAININKTENPDHDERPIGVFDSGIGGLTVVKELKRLLPNENIIYFGDTARVPYGGKSYKTIIRYSDEITNFLIRKNIKLIVVACNTASSVALLQLRKKYKIPVLGVIGPAARSAVRSSDNLRIGIIGTIGTVSSGAYKQALEKQRPGIKVFQTPCPMFVPIAEEGLHKSNIAQIISDKYLSSLKKKNIDTLILGCTHYPLLKKVISNTLGKKVKLIDAGRETAMEVKKILIERNMINKNKRNGFMIFYVSDLPLRFTDISKRFLGMKPDKVFLVKQDELYE